MVCENGQDMYAVVSLLDEHNYARLENLWRELEVECGLTGVTLTPLPHFSWHIAADYDFKRLEAVLTGLAAETKPFTVRTFGLGVFTSESPVIYIPVVKDAYLCTLHQRVWEDTQPAAVGSSSHYSPATWVPHITLAFGDVDRIKLGCAMEKLVFQSFKWEISIDNLALVYTLGGQIGKLQNRFPFNG